LHKLDETEVSKLDLIAVLQALPKFHTEEEFQQLCAKTVPESDLVTLQLPAPKSSNSTSQADSKQTGNKENSSSSSSSAAAAAPPAAAAAAAPPATKQDQAKSPPRAHAPHPARGLLASPAESDPLLPKLGDDPFPELDDDDREEANKLRDIFRERGRGWNFKITTVLGEAVVKALDNQEKLATYAQRLKELIDEREQSWIDYTRALHQLEATRRRQNARSLNTITLAVKQLRLDNQAYITPDLASITPDL